MADCMIRMAASISATTARIRSRMVPDSSSRVWNSTNCFSIGTMVSVAKVLLVEEEEAGPDGGGEDGGEVAEEERRKRRATTRRRRQRPKSDAGAGTRKGEAAVGERVEERSEAEVKEKSAGTPSRSAAVSLISSGFRNRLRSPPP